MTLLLLLGCGNGISNALFADDANFIAALPSEEQHTLAYGGPEAAKAVDEAAPYLALVSYFMAVRVNETVRGVLVAVDTVKSLPPAEREQDLRRWGPYDWQDGVTVTAEMERTGDEYAWAIDASRDGTEAGILEGTHEAGATVAQGDGEFVWDLDAQGELLGTGLRGTFSVDYDNREGVDLIADGVGITDGVDDPLTARVAWRNLEGERDFQYQTELDVEGDGSSELATVQIRTRADPTGAGRADAVVTGGGLGGREMEWTQCWDATYGLSYEHDSLGINPDSGEESACVYEEFARVDRL